MSSVEQTSTKGISLKFPPITSVSLAYKSNLVETPLTTITEHVQVQYTGTPIMYRVPVFNVAVDHQQAEITQKAPEPFPVIPTLQETLYKMMSGMTQMEISCLKCKKMYLYLYLQTVIWQKLVYRMHILSQFYLNTESF